MLRPKIKFCAAGLLIITLLAAVLAIPQILGARLIRTVQQSAAQEGLKLSFQQEQFSWFGFRSGKVELSYTGRRFFAFAELHNLVLSACPAGFSPVAMRLDAKADFYGGTLAAEFVLAAAANGIRGRASVAEFDLAKHPQLQILGVKSGKANLELSQLNYLEAAGLKYSGMFKLKELNYNLPIPNLVTALPPIQDLNLSFAFRGSEGNLEINYLDALSNLGSITGQARIDLPKALSPGSLKLGCEIRRAAPALKSLLGAWLSGPVEHDDFRLSLEGDFARPIILVTGL